MGWTNGLQLSAGANDFSTGGYFPEGKTAEREADH
jgi:hypothetical protein